MRLHRDHEPALALWALCLLLVVLLCAEWTYKRAAHDAVRRYIDAAPASSGGAEDLRAGGFTLAGAGRFEAIRQRPLFFAERKAPVQVVATEPEKPFDARLDGVIGAPDGVVALITSHDGRHHRLQPGGRYQGWELAEAFPDRVVFRRGGELRQLLLQKSKLPAVPNGAQLPMAPPSSMLGAPATSGKME